jgi:hypothetical protein
VQAKIDAAIQAALDRQNDANNAGANDAVVDPDSNSKNGWTAIFGDKKGCCISADDEDYDWYQYTVDSLERCKLKCEVEPRCRGVEYPWDTLVMSGICRMVMEDGFSPNVDRNSIQSRRAHHHREHTTPLLLSAVPCRVDRCCVLYRVQNPLLSAPHHHTPTWPHFWLL